MKKKAERINAQVEKMAQRIARRFLPERIILFGSHARKQSDYDSDVDILVVMDVKGSRKETRMEIRRALRDIRVPKDIVVTTPQDFAWRRYVPGTIERPAAQEGRLLYVAP